MPETEEYFYPLVGQFGRWRGKCRRCYCDSTNAYHAEDRAAGKAARSQRVGKFAPRVVGDAGPTGGFTEYQQDGFRFAALPDSHGYEIDAPAAEAALAFLRYYRPAMVVMLGDHVDLCAVSRFRKSPEQRYSIGKDMDAARAFVGRVRESAGPDARILYLKGNHEARLQHYIWEHADALDGLDGMTVQAQLRLADHGVEWVESGTYVHSEALIFKHGRAVRKRSAYTAHAELERNGVSGVSGHTHRLGQAYSRNRRGMLTWVEAGTLCKYDPDYMEGDIADWQQGLAFGTISTTSHRFSVFTAPIINGRVLVEGREIGP